jgi:hypothetical protein
MSVNGTQLVTYNPNITYFTSTTAGTSGVVVYAVEAGVGQNGGITNTPPTGYVYDGMTHFANVAGKHGSYIGDPGNEIPLTDKQGIVTYLSGSISAGTSTFVVAPYQCTLSGYYTAITTPQAALSAISVINTAGTVYLTYTPTATGSANDTYPMALGTGGSITVAAGTPIQYSMVASGTAQSTMITLVMTRVGI